MNCQWIQLIAKVSIFSSIYSSQLKSAQKVHMEFPCLTCSTDWKKIASHKQHFRLLEVLIRGLLHNARLPTNIMSEPENAAALPQLNDDPVVQEKASDAVQGDQNEEEVDKVRAHNFQIWIENRPC